MIVFGGSNNDNIYKNDTWVLAEEVAEAAASRAKATPHPDVIDDLVAANRILSDQGVVDGFGHVSVRHDTDPGRFLLARSMAPGLVSADDILGRILDHIPVP